MEYNDSNTNLSENQWQQMAKEYENAQVQDNKTSEDEVALSLFSLFHNVETTFSKLSSLFNFKTYLTLLYGSNRFQIPQKSIFFSTPTDKLNKQIFENINLVIPRFLSEEDSVRKKEYLSLLNALVNLGVELNTRKTHGW